MLARKAYELGVKWNKSIYFDRDFEELFMDYPLIEMENINIVGRHLISRGIIINLIKSFCQNMNITSLELIKMKFK